MPRAVQAMPSEATAGTMAAFFPACRAMDTDAMTEAIAPAPASAKLAAASGPREASQAPSARVRGSLVVGRRMWQRGLYTCEPDGIDEGLSVNKIEQAVFLRPF